MLCTLFPLSPCHRFLHGIIITWHHLTLRMRCNQPRWLIEVLGYGNSLCIDLAPGFGCRIQQNWIPSLLCYGVSIDYLPTRCLFALFSLCDALAMAIRCCFWAPAVCPVRRWCDSGCCAWFFSLCPCHRFLHGIIMTWYSLTLCMGCNQLRPWLGWLVSANFLCINLALGCVAVGFSRIPSFLLQGVCND